MATVLSEARRLATGADLQRLDELAGRLEDQRLRVLVAGEAKRGKSTLVNALLGRDLLPTGVIPLTAVATAVTAARPAEQEHALVTFTDGRRQAVALDRIAQFVTEAANPGNTAEVRDVLVRVHSPLLSSHAVDLVDTPGTGSVHVHNTAEARTALGTLDAAVLVLTADPPISEAERELLKDITARSVHTFVVLNKSDRMLPEEVQEAVRFTERVCADAIGQEVLVLSCSARRGEDDPGFSRFATTLTDYLRDHGRQDTARAIRGHLRGVLTAMLDEARLRLRTHELVEQGRGRAVAELQLRLESIAARRSDIRDGCTGSLRRLRKELDDSASTVRPDLTRRCSRAFDSAWEEQLDDTPLADLEPRAWSICEQLVTSTVEEWRAATRYRLEDGLAHVVDQAGEEVTTALELARKAVQETMDLTLSGEGPASTLAVAEFHYDFAVPVGWAPPLKQTLSRLTTPERRRRRVRAAVTGHIAFLTDRQLGRARSDLQQRLADSGRSLAVALDGRFAQTIGRLLDAVSEVSGSRQSLTDGLADEPDLPSQIQALERLLLRLGPGTPEP